MRLRLIDLKESFNVASTLNVCPNEDDFLMILNQALERLMHRGKWVGTIQRYQLCQQEACITLPRQFQTVEVMDVCTAPIPIRNQWFEFLDNGPGRMTSNTTAYFDLADRGRGYAMFKDPTSDCVFRFVCRNDADAGKTILIRGLDTSGDKVLSATGTEGETVTLAAGPDGVDTVAHWKPQSIRDVIKAVTLGYVDVYWYPVGDSSSLTKCAQWEPSETLPDYRRYYLPYITRMNGCDSTAGECGETAGSCSSPDVTVTALCKMAYTPISDNNDFLPISNASALKLAMRAVMLEERGDWEGARVCMEGTWDAAALRFVGGAIPLLEEELAEQLGDGVVHTPRFQSAYTWGCGGVENMID